MRFPPSPIFAFLKAHFPALVNSGTQVEGSSLLDRSTQSFAGAHAPSKRGRPKAIPVL